MAYYMYYFLPLFTLHFSLFTSLVLSTTLNLSFILKNGFSKYLYDSDANPIVNPVIPININAKHTPPPVFEHLRIAIAYLPIVLCQHIAI